MQGQLPISMKNLIEEVKTTFSGDQKAQELFENCFSNTYETTIRPQEDGTTFVITGDIPAMWLRDSAAQVRPYLMLAEHDGQMADLIEGVIQKQFSFINHDPYANAFNEEANGNRYHDDNTEMTPLLWERKYEIDSLCYPVQLGFLFWKSTGRTSHFNETFRNAVDLIIETFKTEQNHAEDSTYHFERDNCPPQDTLSHNGKGAPVSYTGMTWSGFRPSDDACKYGYLIPANMFAVVSLKQLAEVAEEVLEDISLVKAASDLAEEIHQGIQKHGKVEHPEYGTIYAYETDGFGNYNLMDDANVPSLLSLPYLGYCDVDDPIYQNTRNFILSEENPYYFQGKVAKGIGSPHTPEHYIWHIALAIQGMTAASTDEKDEIFELFKKTDAATNFMHEGFHVDEPEKFTRPWFSWANSMFSEFLLSKCNRYVKGSPLEKQ
ncbi:metal-independent alpha-mannosidase [Virgibacillus profundi]|uniref:Metal-independent alpha-mannosidase n=1 Tax=Virgibacillus profundi TaxID=2024555 RepID=A0A2A2IIR7_9BACI|nr:glycoside hydrolase family 125 protein [Virgibacillus profundi]PAV31216.1 metal-independent alpha-mannosidase [Virgibacillus profundi]PXY55399.1 glycoside hydrolase family 125 protein [Virgibacillus profundi]